MKTLNTLSKNMLAAGLLASLLPLSAFAQATKSLSLSPANSNFTPLTGSLMGMNLIQKIRESNPSLASALEIQMVKVEARAGIGGSQVLLRINGQMVDSVVVETDPDKSSDIARAELRNITRGDLSEATLVVQNFKNIKINSIEVILGPVAEVTILGKYSDSQANRVGGVDDTQDTKPTDATITTIQQRYYTPGLFPDQQPPAGVSVPAPVATPTAPAVVKDTGYNKRGEAFKVGTVVQNRFGRKGVVVAINLEKAYASVRYEDTVDLVSEWLNDLYK